jgi:hypothetical protein
MSSILGSHPRPSCSKCTRPLEYGQDSLKTKDRYWRNCKRCRDKNNSAKYKAKSLPVNVAPSYQIRKRYPPTPLSSSRVTPLTGTTLSRSNLQPTRPAFKLWGDFRSRPSSFDSTSNVSEINRSTLHSKSKTIEPECSVCSDSFAINDFPSLDQCTHEPRVCRGCFSDWLASQVGNTSWDRIVCPSEECGVLITHEQMSTLASTETYTR